MTIRKIIRTAAVLIAFGALSACQTTTSGTETQSAGQTVPVSVADVKAAYFAQNPGATSVTLFNVRARGFTIHSDNTMTYNSFRSRSGSNLRGDVTHEGGNRICMDKVGTWTGACIDLFRRANGSIQVRYKFGNNRGNSYTVRGFSM